MDLFEKRLSQVDQPLAERLRPQGFDQVLGQENLFSQNQLLIEKLKQGRLQNLILWGPPGCGKTSFAKAILNEVKAQRFSENAIDLGAKRIRELGEEGRRLLLETSQKSVVFVDEIHRLNRGQQDVLLPFIEKGYFYLIGATTENPSYQLNGALMSRCRLLVFSSLQQKDLARLIERACQSAGLEVSDLLSPEACDRLLQVSHGDARKLLNLMEEILFAKESGSTFSFPLPSESLNELFQSAGLRFDRQGDEHYDTISAFIKSIRGSDPDAGIYYLARMLEGGEDPMFIARRLVIIASEDVGNADPQALNVAVNGLLTVEKIGLPEARITLAQVVTYLACAPKSNRSYLAINKAQSVVGKTGPLEIPKSLRSSRTALMKDLGYGANYQYSHDGATGWLPQDFLPEGLKERSFYEPSGRGFEKRMAEYLEWMKGQKPKT